MDANSFNDTSIMPPPATLADVRVGHDISLEMTIDAGDIDPNLSTTV